MKMMILIQSPTPKVLDFLRKECSGSVEVPFEEGQASDKEKELLHLAMNDVHQEGTSPLIDFLSEKSNAQKTLDLVTNSEGIRVSHLRQELGLSERNWATVRKQLQNKIRIDGKTSKARVFLAPIVPIA